MTHALVHECANANMEKSHLTQSYGATQMICHEARHCETVFSATRASQERTEMGTKMASP